MEQFRQIFRGYRQSIWPISSTWPRRVLSSRHKLDLESGSLFHRGASAAVALSFSGLRLPPCSSHRRDDLAYGDPHEILGRELPVLILHIVQVLAAERRRNAVCEIRRRPTLRFLFLPRKSRSQVGLSQSSATSKK